MLLENEEKRPLKIKFKDAARNWTDALPIGNGRLGAMVHGGILSEIINLNGIFYSTQLFTSIILYSYP